MGSWLQVVGGKLASRFRQPEFDVHMPLLRVFGSVSPEAMLPLLRNVTRSFQRVKLSILNQVFVDKSEYFNSKQLSLRISVSPRKDVEAIASKFAHQFPASMVSTPAPSLILMDDLRSIDMQQLKSSASAISRELSGGRVLNHLAVELVCIPDGGYRDRYKLWRYSPKDV
mmetsp:Transcript_18724/g.42910  ORF Transcript_18724/g.42910 Transcript_18724/m.42910 type:complete len:170 (+) Transcript_18724:788-1297(+)